MERLKIKEKYKQPKFSEEQLFEMIVANNSTSELGSDGELKLKQSGKLYSAVREIGSDSIDYQAKVKFEKAFIRDLAVTGGGMVSLWIHFGMYKQLQAPGLDPFLFSVGAATSIGGLIRLIYVNAKLPEKGLSKQVKKEIKIKLEALSLPQEYISKNFDKITEVLAEKERTTRAEEESTNRANYIHETRKRFGLTDTYQDVSLEQLVESKSIKKSK